MLFPVPLRSRFQRVTKKLLRPMVLSAGLRTAPRTVRTQPPPSSFKVPILEPTIRNTDSTFPKTKAPSAELDTISKSWTSNPFPKSKLQYRWETLPPTIAQLEYADKFFVRSQPEFLWSAPKFHSMSFGSSPEICILGRSNIGKSSLLNALFGRVVAHSSSKPGRTKMMNAFGIGSDGANHKNRLVVLDMPGYGKGGQAVWGKEILKYLSQRKQLMRAFLLIDTEHGIKTSDEQILGLFRRQNIPHQVVFSKVDKLLFPSARMPSEGHLHARLRDLEQRMEKAKEIIQPDQEDEGAALGELMACSSEKRINGYAIGIDLVRHAMLRAADLELKPELKKVAETPETVPWDQIPVVGPSG